MRILVYILMLFVPICSMAAEPVEFAKPVESDIEARTLDASSPYFHPNLMIKYRDTSASLTDEEYFYLYYGFAYSDLYAPLESNPAADKVDMLMATMNLLEPNLEQLQLMRSYVLEAIERDPFSPRLLNYMAYMYGAIGDTEREKAYSDRFNGIVGVIERSGDGRKESSARHVLSHNHAKEYMAAKDVAVIDTRIVSRSVEYLKFEKKYDGRAGAYFNYERMYRNRPQNDKYERPRTWQINNLRPRPY